MVLMAQNNPLWQDFQAQSDNLRRVIARLLGQEMPRLEQSAAFLENEKPIAFIGIGSAAYLCEPAAAVLQQYGRPSYVVCASDALYNALPSLRAANVVINSRSGETIEVVKVCQALAQEGIPYILITNEPGSTAAQWAKHIIWCDSRKDELVSINIVTSMMTATLILALEAMGLLDSFRPALERLPDTLAEVARKSSAWAGSIRDLFLETRPIYLLYRGADKGAAYCGRLVLEEVARRPAIAMEAGDFRQGPIEVVDARFGAVIFAPQGAQGKLNRTLAQNILENQGRVMLVGNCAESFAENHLNISIADTPNELLSVAAVVPAQVLAYQLAQAQGYAPGQVRYISRVITTEEGIPNQGA